MKICQAEKCEQRVFGKGFCKNHQYLRPDFKASALKRQPVKKQSDKEKVRQQAYRKQRIEFLKYIPNCEVKAEGCTGVSTDVHHKCGRLGENLLNVSTWLSVCRNCHQKIETQPQWAKENGFSVSRLNKELMPVPERHWFNTVSEFLAAQQEWYNDYKASKAS